MTSKHSGPLSSLWVPIKSQFIKCLYLDPFFTLGSVLSQIPGGAGSGPWLSDSRAVHLVFLSAASSLHMLTTKFMSHPACNRRLDLCFDCLLTENCCEDGLA